MRKLLTGLLLIFLSFSAASESFYEINVGREDIQFSNTIVIECEEKKAIDDGCPVNTWRITINKPPEAAITSVESAQGEVESYDDHGGSMVIESYREEGSRSEKVTVNYTVEKNAEQISPGLYTRSLSMPSFEGQKNSGRLEVENLITTSITPSGNFSLFDERINYSASGPARARVVFGEGTESGRYVLFPRKRETGSAYNTASGIVGLNSKTAIPVAVVEGSEYNRSVNTWSAGQYMKDTIVIRNGSRAGFRPILAHETVHAINDDHLAWRADSSWFDEGVAKHVEYLQKTKEGDRTRNLFGEPVQFTESVDGQRIRYTLPSKGEKEKLWQYYTNDRDFMKHWNSDSPERLFGYAYSELVIKNYISRNGSIRELYREIEGSVIDSDREKWRIMSEHLDLTPCKYEDRERFDDCLERVNSYQYVPPDEIPESSKETVAVESPEVAVQNLSENVTESGGQSFISTLLQMIGSLV